MAYLLVQTVELAGDMGPVKLAGVTICGTKLGAKTSGQRVVRCASVSQRAAWLRDEVDAYA